MTLQELLRAAVFLIPSAVVLGQGIGVAPAELLKPLKDSLPTYNGDYTGRRYSALSLEKLMHPGYPNGGDTGMLVKDYRGKNAEQAIWKFDATLESAIRDTLKQAAIEEGQWTEKRQLSGEIGMSEIKRRLNAGRQRVADAKKAEDAAKLAKSGGKVTSAGL